MHTTFHGLGAATGPSGRAAIAQTVAVAGLRAQQPRHPVNAVSQYFGWGSL